MTHGELPLLLVAIMENDMSSNTQISPPLAAPTGLSRKVRQLVFSSQRGAQRLWQCRGLTQITNIFLGAIFPLLMLALWHLVTSHQWLPPLILPTATQVKDTLLDLWSCGDLWSNLHISLIRVLCGFLFGAIAGLLLGCAMGLSSRIEAYLYPSFKAFSQIPVLGWIPLLIMLVGIGEAMKILVIAKAALIPVTINTQQSLRNIPRQYLDVGQVCQLCARQSLLRIILPASLPGIFNGIRYGLTNAWLALVTVEMLASSEGIGYLMVWGRQLAQLDLVMATIVVIGAIGLLLDIILQRISLHLTRWRRLAF
jgi:sulfonate transport system permease protein